MKLGKGILPSNRFLVALTIVAVGVGGALAFKYFLAGGEDGEAATVKKPISETARTVAVAETDSDSDGLMDWEEALWNTDPENPDTDGDGSLDGEEIALGRNPIVSGPDDELAQPEDTTNSTQYDAFSDESLSTTEALSRNLFNRYLELESEGVTVEGSAAEILGAATAQESILRAAQTPRLYTTSDLSVTSSNSPQAIREYGNRLGEILSGTPTKQNNEILALSDFLQTGDPESVGNLDSVTLHYQTLIQSLLALPTPSTLAASHLAMINALQNIQISVSAFKFIKDDPFVALVSLKNYQDGTVALTAALKSTVQTFESSGVSFSEGEAGYLIVSNI